LRRLDCQRQASSTALSRCHCTAAMTYSFNAPDEPERPTCSTSSASSTVESTTRGGRRLPASPWVVEPLPD
jgi:hypothetical protein